MEMEIKDSKMSKLEIMNERNNFIKYTKAEYRAHLKSAWYWDWIYYFLGLTVTILSGVATLLGVIRKEIPDFVVPIITGLATFISALNSFLKPLDKRKSQLESAIKFKVLMFKMIHCDSIKTYKELWCDFYDVLMKEPIMQQRYQIYEESFIDRAWPPTDEFTVDALIAQQKRKKLIDKEMQITELEKNPNPANLKEIDRILTEAVNDCGVDEQKAGPSAKKLEINSGDEEDEHDKDAEISITTQK